MPLSPGDGCLSCPGAAVELGFLLPHLAGAVIEGVVAAGGLLLVLARARAGEARSPREGMFAAPGADQGTGRMVRTAGGAQPAADLGPGHAGYIHRSEPN